MDSLVDEAEAVTRPPWGELARTVTLSAVWAAGKLVVQGLNTTAVQDLDTFRQALQQRPPGTPLVTVSNHTSTVDDPFIFSALIPWSHISSEHRHKGVRWSLCAKEICYKNKLLGQFFQSGKTLPIDRSAGPDQLAMRIAAARAAAGDWVHLFPEGRVGYAGHLAPCKWGVGKLVCDTAALTDRDPLVVPFYHSGMGRVLPKTKIVPRWGNEIHVSVGQPVDLADQLAACRAAQDRTARQQAWKEITLRIREALLELERHSPPNWVQIPEPPEADKPALSASTRQL